MKPKLRAIAPLGVAPEDYASALFARIRARGARRGVDERRIIQDLFIADLTSNRPWSIEQILQLQEWSEDHRFCERFARALAQGRSPTFDKYDLLILRNWRQLCIRVDGKLLEGIPGLRHWSPKAVAALFDGTDMEGFFDSGWYTARRKRLGLKSRRPYRVTDFPIPKR